MIFDEIALRSVIDDVVRNVLREQPHGGSTASAEYVSVAEAARRIDVTPATIREWIGQGRLGRFHAGRELHVKVAELDAMLTRPARSQARSPEEEARLFLERRGAATPFHAGEEGKAKRFVRELEARIATFNSRRRSAHVQDEHRVRAGDLPAPPSDGEEGNAERELATYMAVFVAALPSPYREAITLTQLQQVVRKSRWRGSTSTAPSTSS